jgi:XRE family aerobic/anaerobic benzoate catabolism transcriptional regulator
MSSNILHVLGLVPRLNDWKKDMAEVVEVKNAFLAALGERVRTRRARRGLTRKAVAVAADVS